MKTSAIYSFLFIMLFFVVGAVQNLAAQTITGSIEKGLVSRGDTAKGRIVMTIPAGLHVNSNRPSSEYAIATTVRISAPGLRISPVSYPRGKNRKFQFSEDLINIYEGRVAFTFSVNVPPGFRGRTIRLRVTVRYQACTDEVCYPPSSKSIMLTALVQ